MDDEDAADGRWHYLPDAAERYGLPSAEALRGRIRRDPSAYRTRKANDGRMMVWVPADVRPDAQPVRAATDAGWLIVALMTALTAAVVRADAERERADVLERHVNDLRGRVDRLNEELDRRRWPGLKAWMRRFWHGA